MRDALDIRICRLRFLLRMTGPAQLHAHHAAALYALLSEAYGRATESDPVLPDGLMIDAPEQCRIRLRRDEQYAFGATLIAGSEAEARGRLSRIAKGLESVGRDALKRGAALGGNFVLEAIEDLVVRRVLQADDVPTPIAPEHLAAECARAAECPELSLQFNSPLRCHRPGAARSVGHAFFDREWFDGSMLVRRIHTRLLSLGILAIGPDAWPDDGAVAETLGNRLVWLDVAYGPRGSRKSLGGAVGPVWVRPLFPGVAETLVYGQYVGAGESTRFGFGRYRIAELGPEPYPCWRAVGLVDLALASPALDRAAERYGLESGQVGRLARDVREGRYTPAAPSRVTIEPKHGRLRELVVPAREDRALQRAVLETLAPALDLLFEESSLAYRKGLGRQRAAQRLRDAYRDGFCWAVRADFDHFFDSIEHQELDARLNAYVNDPALVRLLLQWVRCGAPQPQRGLPTGSPLSPLLSNLFLDEFDERIEQNGGRLVRYADDFLILFRTEVEAKRMYQAAAEAAAALHLKLNDEKTDLCDLSEPFHFLGFQFRREGEWQLDTAGAPQHLDDLGWCDAKRPRRTAVGQIRLPGESDVEGPSPQSVVILGPGVEWLGTESGDLAYRFRNGERLRHATLDHIEQVLVLGPATLDGQALAEFAQRQIPVFLADDSGRPLAAVGELDTLSEANLVAQQVRTAEDEQRRLGIARALIRAKLRNYAALADAVPGCLDDRETGPALRALAVAAEQAQSVEQLLGYEGAGGARWYERFTERLGQGFAMERRVAPNAEDPVNVMLNIAQTALYRQVQWLVRLAGFAPAVGIVHRFRAGHAGLASDLQEPFRHLMDRAVIEASWRLRPEDFHKTTRGPFSLELSHAAARRLAEIIQRTLAIPCVAGGNGEARPYRQHIAALVRSLRRHLTSPDEPFSAFEHG